MSALVLNLLDRVMCRYVRKILRYLESALNFLLYCVEVDLCLGLPVNF